MIVANTLVGLRAGAPRVYAEAELARRLDKPANQRAWIVIGVSAASLAVSVAAFLASIFK
jgi:hypothetical protein